MDEDSFFYGTCFPFAAYYAYRSNPEFNNFQTVRDYKLVHKTPSGEACPTGKPCDYCEDQEWCIYRRGNEIIVCCRGTNNLGDILVDGAFALTGNTQGLRKTVGDIKKAIGLGGYPVAYSSKETPGIAQATKIQKTYTTGGRLSERADKILKELVDYLHERGDGISSVVFTGHSLGGEVAARLKDKFLGRPGAECGLNFKQAMKLMTFIEKPRSLTTRGFYVNPAVSPLPNADVAWIRRLKDEDDYVILSVADSVCSGIQRFLSDLTPHADPKSPKPKGAARGVTFITKGRALRTHTMGRNSSPALIQAHDFPCMFTRDGKCTKGIKEHTTRKKCTDAGCKWLGDDTALLRSDIIYYLKQEQKMLARREEQDLPLENLKEIVRDEQKTLLDEMYATTKARTETTITQITAGSSWRDYLFYSSPTDRSASSTSQLATRRRVLNRLLRSEQRNNAAKKS